MRNTRANIEIANPQFIHDQEIKDAYQVLKPVFDKLHEEFITKSLECSTAKKLDINEYFGMFKKMRAEQDKDKKRVIEKDIEKSEGKLRKLFGAIYEQLGEQFKIDAIDQKAKSILDAKLSNATDDKEKKKIEKEIKKLVFLNEKSFKVLTEAGILKYIKSRIDGFVAMKLKTHEGKMVEKSDLEKALGTADSKGVFEGFFTYLSGFNENRENYYSTDEKATAVANRIVQENLPKFCDNILDFQKRKIEYLGVYKFLEEKGIELIGKSHDGQNIDLEPIIEDIFIIEHFVNCLSQPEIEKYNLQLGNANNLINRYNQQQNEKGKKLRIFKALYKQIGCGERKEFIQAIKSDDELKEILKDVAINGEKFFGDFNIGIAGKIDTIGEFCAWMMDNAGNEGVFWSDKAINTVSSKYFANWFILKKALKDGGVFMGKKNDVVDIKIPQAVVLSELFAVLDITANWQSKGGIFKDSLFEDSEKRQLIDVAKKPSEALLKMIFLDVKKMAYDFANLKDEVLAFDSDFQKHEHVQKIKQWLDDVLYVNQILKYWKVKDKFAVDPTLAEALRIILLNEDNPIRAYDIVRNYLTRKPQEVLNRLKLNFDNSVLAGGWDVNKEPERWCIILKDKNDNKYLAVLTDKTKKFFKKEKNNLIYQTNNSSWQKMDYKLVPGPNKMLPKVLLPKKDRKKFGATDEILKIYDEGGFKIDSVTKQVNKDKLEIVIDFFKNGLKIYPDPKSSWQETFGFNFSKTSDYKSIDQFYLEVEKQGYKLGWSNIDKTLLDEKIKNGEIYLFQICNKDNNLKDGISKTGSPNLHTIYWNAIFANRENHPKLNGEAEIFYRPAISIEKMMKAVKKDKNGNEIEVKLKNGQTAMKNYRFSKEKFILHCPLTLNFGAKSYKLNDEINKAMAQHKDKVCFIGIDRGEKHLAYYSVIDQSGKIIEQDSLNTIYGHDYAAKLEERAGNRDEARKNWQTIGSIKELKEGYISLVVRKIVDLAVKHNAYIVLENLNVGFKRGRQKIEKQVYQKLELALAKKLNFLVDKKAKDGEIQSVQDALQLTPQIDNFQDIGTQCGIMIYIRANYTSQTDPITGWRKTIYFNCSKQEDLKAEICDKFDEIRFDGKDYFFTYTTKYEKNTEKRGKSYIQTGKTWTLWSGKDGKSLDRYRGRKNMQGVWEIAREDIVKLLNEAFKGFDKKKSLRDQILDEGKLDNSEVSKLKYAIELIQQIRNSGAKDQDGKPTKDDDFILSPVRDKNGDHFDSREKGAIVPNGDANGAYNIARKGLMTFGKIQNALKNAQIGKDGKEKIEYDLFVSDVDWDKWLFGTK